MRVTGSFAPNPTIGRLWCRDRYRSFNPPSIRPPFNAFRPAVKRGRRLPGIPLMRLDRPVAGSRPEDLARTRPKGLPFGCRPRERTPHPACGFPARSGTATPSCAGRNDCAHNQRQGRHGGNQEYGLAVPLVRIERTSVTRFINIAHQHSKSPKTTAAAPFDTATGLAACLQHGIG